MTVPPRSRSNRGPAAAAGNRQALIGAARRLFAERPGHLPFSAVAREAGVSQAVLYRHFPDRSALLTAVFEDRLAELEELAARPGGGGLAPVWDRVAALVVAEAALIESAISTRDSEQEPQAVRMRALVARTLEHDRGAGRLGPGSTGSGTTVEDVMVAAQMLWGAVISAPGPARAATAATARALLEPMLFG